MVRKSFDLDELVLKDQVRTSALGFAKNPKQPENEWAPAEKLIDGKLLSNTYLPIQIRVITLARFHGKVKDQIL